MDEESTRGRGFHRESPAYLSGFRPVRSKSAENPSKSNNSRISFSKSYSTVYTEKMPTMYIKNSNTKTSLKLKINLIRPY
jgi:hypothetical protein